MEEDNFFSYIGLKVQEAAALLGVAPQTISSYSSDLEFLKKQQRIQRLHKALTTIGGDKYLLAAKKLSDYSRDNGIEIFDDIDFSRSLSADEIYKNSSEIWFFSDNPTKIISWDELKSSIFVKNISQKSDTKRIFSFFFRTIDGATRFSELLEREAFSPLIDENKRISYESGSVGLIYNVNIYNIVTNLVPYGEDFIITNPGSSCIISQPLQPEVFFWDGKNYRRSINSSLSLIEELRKLGIGINHATENFFPRGILLKRDVFFHDSPFTDPLVGKRGETAGGIIDKSGILLGKYNEAEKAINIDFSKKTEFIPIAILALKRLVGSSFSSYKDKVYKAISSELGENTRKILSTTESEQFW